MSGSAPGEEFGAVRPDRWRCGPSATSCSGHIAVKPAWLPPGARVLLRAQLCPLWHRRGLPHKWSGFTSSGAPCSVDHGAARERGSERFHAGRTSLGGRTTPFSRTTSSTSVARSGTSTGRAPTTLSKETSSTAITRAHRRPGRRPLARRARHGRGWLRFALRPPAGNELAVPWRRRRRRRQRRTRLLGQPRAIGHGAGRGRTPGIGGQRDGPDLAHPLGRCQDHSYRTVGSPPGTVPEGSKVIDSRTRRDNQVEARSQGVDRHKRVAGTRGLSRDIV